MAWIQSCLESFEKDSNIDFESLPKPITPEYLYNCPSEKRNAIFQDVINQYIEKKTDLEANIRQAILNYKKVDKATFQLIKKDIMTKLENEKSRVEKYKQIIELFQNNTIYKLYFDNFLIRDNWAAIHYRYRKEDKKGIEKYVGDRMEFFKFEEKEGGLKIMANWIQ